MSEHALSVLDFPRVLELAARHATSEAGRAAVLSMKPRTDREWVERELTRVWETGAFLRARPKWSPPEIPDCSPLFERLAVEGSVLEGAELHAVGVSLGSGGQLAEALDAECYTALAFIRNRLHTDPDLEGRIAKITDASGEILDSASHDLRRIRKQLHGSRNKIVRKLEAFIADLPERVRVADASVGMRDGRYVVPVRREGKGRWAESSTMNPIRARHSSWSRPWPSSLRTSCGRWSGKKRGRSITSLQRSQRRYGLCTGH